MEPVQEDRAKKKKTQLLLNTPGACFLCLQDNYGDDEGGPEDLNGGIIDLTNICRYLNINQCSLLLTSLNNDADVEEDLKQDLCTFSVHLCPKCVDLTRKLNDMIVQLKKAKLMVNYHLSSFHKVLKGEKENLEWINLQERMNANSDSSLEAKLVQILREETRDKSLRILKKAEAAMPKVILSKCKPPPPPAPQKTSIPPPSSSDPPPITSTTSTSGTSIKTLLKHLVATNSLGCCTNNNRKSPLYRCPFCSKILGVSKFALHLVCLHPSKLLSSNLPSSSLPPSEEICRQVLYSQVIAKATKIPSTKTPKLTRLGCHLCGITYSNGNILKHHFLTTHTNQLIEAITNFDKNPQISSRKLPNAFKKIAQENRKQIPAKKVNLIKSVKSPRKIVLTLPPPLKLKAQKNCSVQKLIKRLLLRAKVIETPASLYSPENDSQYPKFTKNLYQCPFCKKCPVYSKFARHLCNLHPDKLLAKFSPSVDKLRNDNSTYFRQLCRKLLRAQVTMAITKISEGDTSPSKLSCHLCPRKYSEGQNLKHHFLVKHTDHLTEQLIKMKHIKIKTEVQDKQKIPKKRGRPFKDKSLKVNLTEQLIKMENIKIGGVQDKNNKTFKKRGRPFKDKSLKLTKPLKRKPLKVKILKKKLRRVGQGPKTCTICNLTFSKPDKLRRHQVSQHPDQLFLECKPSLMEGPQFREICKEIFRSEVAKATFGKPGDKIYSCGYCPDGKSSYKGHQDLVIHLVFYHREEMEEIVRQTGNGVEKGEENVWYGGDDGGDDMVIEEEDASEFDVKPEVGQFGELLYPDMVLNELSEQFGYLEEKNFGGDLDEVDENKISYMTDVQFELPYQLARAQQIIKMEVN